MIRMTLKRFLFGFWLISVVAVAYFSIKLLLSWEYGVYALLAVAVILISWGLGYIAIPSRDERDEVIHEGAVYSDD